MTSVKFVYGNEVRRILVGEEGERLSLDDLLNIVWELFPSLQSSDFTLQWTDDEGDVISIGLERELQEAVRVSQTSGQLLRFTISQGSDPAPAPAPAAQSPADDVDHAHVTCDKCGMYPIKGIRYKCAVRDDFDLCEGCEAKQLQPYPMIKISDPRHALLLALAASCGSGGRGRGRAQYWRRSREQQQQAELPSRCPFRSQQQLPYGHGQAGGCPEGFGQKMEPHLLSMPFGGPLVAVVESAMDAFLPKDKQHPATPTAASLHAPTTAPAAPTRAPASEASVEDQLLEQALKESLEEAERTYHHLASTPASAKPSLRFVKDVTYPDNSIVMPDSLIRKIWHVRNDGEVVWPAGAVLASAGGDLLPAGALLVPLPALAPGEEAEVAVDLHMPSAQNLYTIYFRAQTEAGEGFGQRLWASIVVAGNADAAAEWQVVNEAEYVAAVAVAEEEAGAKDWKAAAAAAGAMESKEEMLVASEHELASSQTAEITQLQALALLWRRELEILNGMGFHDLEMILPLLQTHLACPVSLSADKTAAPRLEGMQRVVSSLLAQGLTV